MRDGMTDTVQRFRKKPVEVEAMRYEVHVRYDWTGARAVAAWCGGKFFPGAPGSFPQKPGYPHIELASGEWVDPGDWIVRDIDGKFTQCSPEVFELTHEPVGPALVPEKQTGRTKYGNQDV